MKKIVLAFCSIFLFAMGIVSCNNDEGGNDDSIITPIDNVSNDVKIFFDEEFANNAFNLESVNGVVAVNNISELEDIYEGEKPFPDIDFSKYTLIIGEKAMPSGGYYVNRQELNIKLNTLNVYLKNDLDYQPQVITHLYFWGLYIKYEKSIFLNVIND
jgi:hypothetical protein